MSDSTSSPARKQRKRRASRAGLVYVNSYDGWIVRRRCGRGFTYLNGNGTRVKVKKNRKRIDALVIPPAWTEVRICPSSDGHIQAIGNDTAGRRQIIYHPRWEAISSATKFDRMHLFGEHLPRLRRRIRRDLNRQGLEKPRVLAAVVRLIDKAHLRVGSSQYTEQNKSRGATTLAVDNVSVDQTRVSLEFLGKSGQHRELELADQKVADVVRDCAEIDGQYLFQFMDDHGVSHSIDSTTVNQYLRDASGIQVTAKDFRTWWGCTIALDQLQSLEEEMAQSKRKAVIGQAITTTAALLGNTKAVCRHSYIHPALLTAAASGELVPMLKDISRDALPELTTAESLLVRILPRLEFT